MQLRNTLSSHTRGLLTEYGIVVPQVKLANYDRSIATES